MFQFYSTHRKCPTCRNPLLTATLVTRAVVSGPLQRMGVTCYCVSCNRRYRAASRLPYAAVGWLGPLGRRLWWLTTSFELTLKPEEF
ncbi:MAG: hypothetical protein Q7J69_01170 [Candidatus Omnitrophota bacterium]|nr:hypothetical protein [Candidatus Omnitrophota bacterium]